MKKHYLLYFLLFCFVVPGLACDKCKLAENNLDFSIKSASVTHNKKWGLLEFEIVVEGQAGYTTPKPAGQLNGAPVMAYVFPTTLRAEDVGFSKTEGIVALALTSHPDFDDSPLWDENADGKYDNDGLVWHPHWVVLVKDDRVKGGLAVKEFSKSDKTVKLPPTAPDMPMFMDSPGFQVIRQGSSIRVVVPTYRLNYKTSFKFDAVACYLEVSTGAGGHGSEADLPMLGVYKVYSVLSKELTLPYAVQ